jgi:hypothetical protein
MNCWLEGTKQERIGMKQVLVVIIIKHWFACLSCPLNPEAPHQSIWILFILCLIPAIYVQ